MIDPQLNRRLENNKKLLIYWRKFHEFLDRAIKGADFTSQDEAEFLKLKSQIAILHDSLLDSIENTKENMATAQSVISLVERCILLRQVQKMNLAEIKKMQIEWHEAYLLINETIGLLEEKIAKIAKVSYAGFATKRATDRAFSSVSRVATNKTFHFFLALGGLIIGLVVLPYMGVFNYDFLQKNEMTNKFYQMGRSMARSSIMKNLEFQEWAEYSWGENYNDGGKYFRKPMPDGFQPNKEVAPAFVTYAANHLFVKNYADLTPLDLQKTFAVGEKVIKTNTEFYLKDQQPVVVFLCQFKKSADAVSVEAQIKDWEEKIPKTSPAKAIEEKISYGREANFLFMIYAETAEYHAGVIATLHGTVLAK